jgi:hypothetical protein
VQQIAERFIGKLLKGFHGLPREQVKRMPGLLIEPHKLAPKLCWLLGHKDLLSPNSRSDNIAIMPQRPYLIFRVDVLSFWYNGKRPI